MRSSSLSIKKLSIFFGIDILVSFLLYSYMMHQQKQYKLMLFIGIFFVAVLMISNIVSTKILDLGVFTFDGGTLLFPLSYIFGDILTEVYGYKQSRKIIWMGCGAILLMAGTIMLVGRLPAAQDWQYQESYQHILGLTPRIVVASLLAYVAGEFSNSYILAKMKIRMRGRRLWMRTIGSTLVGELLDTSIFVAVAFYGIFTSDILLAIMISNYIFKVGIEIIFTPLTYIVIGKLKKIEHEDYYDYDTNFNPLTFK